MKRGSGESGNAPEPRYLVVGRIVGAHGLRGELKVEVMTDEPSRFDQLEQVYMGLENQEPVARKLKSYRPHKDRALLMIEGCSDRTAAEQLRGMLVQIPRNKAIPLKEGEYFEYQILDLEVWTVDGSFLGTVEEILHTGANQVYIVRDPSTDRREILIPAIKEVVVQVDLDAGRLTVDMPEELL